MFPFPTQSVSAIREWEQLTAQIMAQAETLLDSIQRPWRLWQSNNLSALVEATAPGATVGDSTLTREEALARDAMFQALMAWINAPQTIGTDGDGQPIERTPLDLLSKRRA